LGRETKFHTRAYERENKTTSNTNHRTYAKRNTKTEEMSNSKIAEHPWNEVKKTCPCG